MKKKRKADIPILDRIVVTVTCLIVYAGAFYMLFVLPDKNVAARTDDSSKQEQKTDEAENDDVSEKLTVIVYGDSMLNTLKDGDEVPASSEIDELECGDIVVFMLPDVFGDINVIKRVIATGGQTIEIDAESWTVTVDGEVLDEPYITRKEGTAMKVSDGRVKVSYPYTVPKDMVFLMGDNRTDSRDSREFGAVSIENVCAMLVEE